MFSRTVYFNVVCVGLCHRTYYVVYRSQHGPIQTLFMSVKCFLLIIVSMLLYFSTFPHTLWEIHYVAFRSCQKITEFSGNASNKQNTVRYCEAIHITCLSACWVESVREGRWVIMYPFVGTMLQCCFQNVAYTRYQMDIYKGSNST